MRGVCNVLILIAFADFFVEANSDSEASPALVWWPKKPLVFCESETSGGAQELKGILPEIWPTVVGQCLGNLSQQDRDILEYGRTRKVSPLPIPEFSEVMSGKCLLMPVKLRKEKENVLGMSYVKLIDSPGVAVLMKKTLTGTDLLNAILLAWPILIFVVLSASLSGFVIWFLVSTGFRLTFHTTIPKLLNYD